MPVYQKGLVSVLIPSWNRAGIIEKAVNSALIQKYSNIEVLVCDDGSTDNTEIIVKTINDKRLRWIPGAHAGRPAPPRNRGIRESRGEWLAFLDSDDEWLPQKLHKQLELIHSNHTLAACTNAWRVINGKNLAEKFVYWNRRKITFENLLPGNMVINSSVIIHRSLIEKAGGFPEEPEMTAVEDYALWLRIATQTDFSYIDDCLVNYSDEPKKSVRTKNPGFLANHAKVLKNFQDWAKSKKIPEKYIRKSIYWYLMPSYNIYGTLKNAAIKIRREKGKIF